jgi:hypothetical protein
MGLALYEADFTFNLQTVIRIATCPAPEDPHTAILPNATETLEMAIVHFAALSNKTIYDMLSAALPSLHFAEDIDVDVAAETILRHHDLKRGVFDKATDTLPEMRKASGLLDALATMVKLDVERR